MTQHDADRNTAGAPNVCEPCAHAAEHGYWGNALRAGRTHCRDCHATFPTSNKWGHCSACHRTFAGIKAFDAHQRVTKDGDIRPASFCAVSSTGAIEESLLGQTSKPRFSVSASYTLEKRQAAWGDYWSEATDDKPARIWPVPTTRRATR